MKKPMATRTTSTNPYEGYASYIIIILVFLAIGSADTVVNTIAEFLLN